MRVMLTGHTGFKGSWLTLLLKKLGAEVGGYSIDFPRGGLYEIGELTEILDGEMFADVRDQDKLDRFFQDFSPQVAIHFAAQPLVIDSYKKPLDTFTTNVNGTLNFLQSASLSKGCTQILVITTDKVYRTKSINKAHIEDDALGGIDPYSASKAMADLLVQSWSNLNHDKSFLIARAGNVIGAFDTSPNRLVPDINKSHRDGSVLQIRNPESVRPWQHVLDCLGGYLSYLDYCQKNVSHPLALNFGPSPDQYHTVKDVVTVAGEVFPDLETEITREIYPKESNFLTLDSTLAHRTLGWKNVFNFQEAVHMSLCSGTEDAQKVANEQIEVYLARNPELLGVFR